MGSVGRGWCPCGSGSKAKRCCGDRSGSRGAPTSSAYADRAAPMSLGEAGWSDEELGALLVQLRAPFDYMKSCASLSSGLTAEAPQPDHTGTGAGRDDRLGAHGAQKPTADEPAWFPTAAGRESRGLDAEMSQGFLLEVHGDP